MKAQVRLRTHNMDQDAFLYRDYMLDFQPVTGMKWHFLSGNGSPGIVEEVSFFEYALMLIVNIIVEESIYDTLNHGWGIENTIWIECNDLAYHQALMASAKNIQHADRELAETIEY